MRFDNFRYSSKRERAAVLQPAFVELSPNFPAAALTLAVKHLLEARLVEFSDGVLTMRLQHVDRDNHGITVRADNHTCKLRKCWHRAALALCERAATTAA